jgi:hypothetical protein
LKQRRIYLKLRPVAVTTTAALVAAAALSIVPLTDGAVRAEVDRLVAQVSAARRLAFRGTLQARPVTRDAAEAQIGAALAARITNLGVEERILKRLGLIARADDYTKLWAAGALSAPVATYDPTTQRLLVPDFAPLEAQRVPLLHEIAHAIVDRRFDLRQFLTPPPPSPLEGDGTRARLALAEGDATLTAMEVIDPTGAFLRPTALAGIADRLRAAAGEGRPPWLAELSRFVNVDGFLFAAEVRAHHPWSAVDALWRDPPASSEQVLHREKYDACEAPIAVPDSVLPTLPGFERPKATDVLGELVVRAWLAKTLDPELAARAAAGWGGDRAGLYPVVAASASPPDGGTPVASTPALAWLTIWDDTGEADDFARAAESAAGAANVQRRGGAVALWFGPPEVAAQALDGLLEGWRAVKASQRPHPTTRRTRNPTAERRRGDRPRCEAP